MLWHALHFHPPSPLERVELERLAMLALRFTPAVSLDPPVGLLLETGPSLRYFGGLEAFVGRLRARFDEAGHPASIAWAPTPTAARLLARWRDGAGCTDASEIPGRLGELPIALLDSAHERLDALEAAGLRRIGALLALPRTGIARRFGQALLDELDRALARRPDPRAWYAPPASFDAKLELPANIDSAPALAWAAERLVRQLCMWLEALQKAARRFELVIEHGSRHPDTLLAPGLAEPAWQAERLLSPLRERLAITALPAPARALRLRCHELDDAAPGTRWLFPDPVAAAEGLVPLLERLQARLGNQGVQRLQPLPDHRPEAAWRASEPDAAMLRRAPRTGTTHRIAALPRPLWLLAAPIALGEKGGRPFWHGPLTLVAGPERIESGWWDARPVQRDYFVAEDPTHRLLWIYRERLRSDAGGGWFLHGRFG